MDLVVKGDAGEFLVTEQMLFNMPPERFWSVNDWFKQVVASHPDYEFEVLEEMPSSDHIIRWWRRA